MTKRSFSLKPFHEPDCERITIQGEIGRSKGLFSLTCILSGRMPDIVIPEAGAVPERRDRLWEETCFEFLISPRGHEHYWEFNLSPAGHWNVYRFSSYRKGMTEEAVFKSMPFVLEQQPDSLKLSVEFPMDALIDEDQAAELAIGAVIKKNDQTKSYWALAHLGPAPDFHLRDSFLIPLTNG